MSDLITGSRLEPPGEAIVSAHNTLEAEAVSAFEEAFRVPAGHTLRLAPGGGESRGFARSEHEEYDPGGRLVAVYESWAREGGGVAFVKYSPYGWVLSISGRSPVLPPSRARVTGGCAVPGGGGHRRD